MNVKTLGAIESSANETSHSTPSNANKTIKALEEALDAMNIKQ